MEDTRIVIRDRTPSVIEADHLSKRAVELYFRGNAKTLHSTILPYIKFKIEEANTPLKPDPVINELKESAIYDDASIKLGDHVHKLVTDALEEALKEKDLNLERMTREQHTKELQRNAAIGTAFVTFIGALTALITHLSSLS